MLRNFDIAAAGSREERKRIDYRVALPNGLQGFKQRLDSDCQLVLEASTNTFRLVDELKPHVGKIVVTDPAQTREGKLLGRELDGAYKAAVS